MQSKIPYCFFSLTKVYVKIFFVLENGENEDRKVVIKIGM